MAFSLGNTKPNPNPKPDLTLTINFKPALLLNPIPTPKTKLPGNWNERNIQRANFPENESSRNACTRVGKFQERKFPGQFIPTFREQIFLKTKVRQPIRSWEEGKFQGKKLFPSRNWIRWWIGLRTKMLGILFIDVDSIEGIRSWILQSVKPCCTCWYTA